MQAAYFSEKQEWHMSEDGKEIKTYPLEQVPVEILMVFAQEKGKASQEEVWKDLEDEKKNDILQWFSVEAFPSEDFGNFLITHINDAILDTSKTDEALEGGKGSTTIVDSETSHVDPETSEVLDQAEKESEVSSVTPEVSASYGAAMLGCISEDLEMTKRLAFLEDLANMDENSWNAVEDFVTKKVTESQRSEIVKSVVVPMKLQLFKTSALMESGRPEVFSSKVAGNYEVAIGRYRESSQWGKIYIPKTYHAFWICPMKRAGLKMTSGNPIYVELGEEESSRLASASVQKVTNSWMSVKNNVDVANLILKNAGILR